MYWKCKLQYGGWGSETNNGNQSGLDIFMSAMGFPSTQLNGNKPGSYIAQLLADEYNGFDELKIGGRTGNSYEDFLGKFKQQYGDARITQPMTCPLHTLHVAAKTYLQYKFKETKANENDKNLKEIKEKLLKFKGACSPFHELNDEFDKFLRAINVTSTPVENASKQSSSAGAAAGGVLGTAAIGGTAAALATNVGGVTTALKNLIPIFK
ncbi:TonB-dependent receptor [Babesia caballi]|uniref:TonB-dependent receptor n=1 Tax=Babesia caballi TaxID=5871 RepID=A0AAV4LPB7_BABCB|nr:TonB-dependent receptor [Babesia caballi]